MKLKDLLKENYDDNLNEEENLTNFINKHKELEGIVNSLNEEKKKLKGYVDSYTSEIANWKKKYRETLTEEEQKRQEQEEFINNLKLERDTLKREKDFSNYKSNFLSLGYSDDLASVGATALLDGETDKVFEIQKTFIQLQKEQQQADLMKQNPAPKEGVKTKTAKDYKNASYEELAELYETNKELFNKL